MAQDEIITDKETPTVSEKELKQIPTDIFSDEMPQKEILPLDDEVIKKDYTALPDEPAQPSGSDIDPTSPPESGDTTNPQTPPPEPKMTSEDEQQSAEQTLQMFFRGYELLHSMGRSLGKVDVNGLLPKANLNQELPIGKKPITYGEFFDQYNEGIDEAISVDDDFKNALRPPATREIIRRKLFINDGLACLLIIGEDIVVKTSMLIGLKYGIQKVVKLCIENTKKQKAEEAKPKTETQHPDAETHVEDRWQEARETNTSTDNSKWRESSGEGIN